MYSNKHVLQYLADSDLSQTVNWLMNICGVNDTFSKSRRSYEHAVEAVTKKEVSLLKNRARPKVSDQLDQFYQSEFKFPKNWSKKEKCRKNELVEKHPSRFLIDAHAEAAYKLATELQTIKEEKQQLDLNLNSSYEEKRQQEKDFNQCLEFTKNEEAQKIIEKEKEIDTKRSQLEEKRKALKRSLQRERYYRSKIEKVAPDNGKVRTIDDSESDSGIGKYEKDLHQMKAVVTDLKQRLNQERQTNEWLQSLLEDNSIVELYDQDTHSFTSKLTLCVYDLLDQNVATSKIPGVINTVLRMADLKPNRLPSPSTVKNMNIGRLICSQKQLGEKLSKDENVCLMSDETSKFGKKIQGFHVADNTGTPWVLGMRDLESKSSEHILQAFKEVLSDIDKVAESTDNNVSKRLLYNISSTMSDKAATEAKFHELLQEYRKDILPDIVENYSTLPETDQMSLASVHNFFCGLHSLVHIADASNIALVTSEQEVFADERPIFDKSFQKSSESGAARLVRTASKAFSRGGDESAGCHGRFMDIVSPFLQTSGLTSLPLLPYRGHRFNILLSNAAALFFLKDQIFSYLQDFQDNKLLRAVFFDIRVPQYMAGVKSLGLLSKLVTEPLWTAIEKKNVHILDMNQKYKMLVSFLKDAALNIPMFMAGKMHVFGEETWVKRDKIYESLMEEWEHDHLVETTLSVLLSAVAKVCEHQFKDHLVGGKLDGMEENEHFRRQTTSVPRHNKFSESVFGFFDQLTRTKPSISGIAAEAYTAFTFNKTSEWLHLKNKDELEEILVTAKKGVQKTREKFKERQNQIKMARRQRMEEKRLKERAAKQRKLERLERYTTDMINFGLWQTCKQVDDMLEQLNGISLKRAAIQAQLNFRRYVFQQSSTKGVFNFTKLSVNNKRQPLTIQELTTNLKSLITSAFEKNPSSFTDPLVGKTVKHWFEESTDSSSSIQRVAYSGQVLSQSCDPKRQVLSHHDHAVASLIATSSSGDCIRREHAKVEDYMKTIINYCADDFAMHFRMQRSSAEKLIRDIQGDLRGADPERQVLSSIWVLSNQESFRGVADRFGYERGQCHRIFMDFAKTLTNRSKDFICWPTEEQMRRSMSNFENRYGFPGVVGCIDGTHINIKGQDDRQSYINRKGVCSIQVQAVCDQSLKFLDVYTGWPGSVHDARVYKESPLFELLTTGNAALPKDSHLLGDAAYPLSSSLMTPFRDNGFLTNEQKKYNNIHSSCRSCIERAFAHLKGKFRRLKFLDMSLVEKIPDVIIAACVLHNYIIQEEKVEFENVFVDAEVGGYVDSTNPPEAATTKRNSIAANL